MNKILVAIAWQVGLIFLATGSVWGDEHLLCSRDAVDEKVLSVGLGERLDFLEKMAQEECAWSYYFLSEWYEDSADKERVLFLLEESGKMGDERSLRRLGSYYSFGVGTLVKDFVKAYGLYRLAGYMGDKGTDFLAYKLSKNMSEAEIMRGEKLFHGWREDWQLDQQIDGDL